ncbi:MAG: type II secretion system major pseudopilin GspG [Verrucomicrobiaceae bacterium]
MKHIQPASARPNAFTLLEMMVVLLIIALIIGSVAVMVQGISGNAEVVTTGGKIKTLESALTSYKIANLVYPTQEQGLDALVNKPRIEPLPKRWTQQIKADGLLDAWGRKIMYRNPGTKNANGYDVYSFGPDGVENSADDIGNW